MKLEIKKAKSKIRNRRITFKIKSEQLLAINNTEEWLALSQEYLGPLPWSEHLAEKIEAEIKSRRNIPTNNFVEHKLTLPLDLVNRMKQSDEEYRERGYIPDWDGRVRSFIDQLIRNYFNQLEKLLDQDAPLELLSYQRKNKKKAHVSVVQIEHGDLDAGTGASHGSS